MLFFLVFVYIVLGHIVATDVILEPNFDVYIAVVIFWLPLVVAAVSVAILSSIVVPIVELYINWRTK